MNKYWSRELADKGAARTLNRVYCIAVRLKPGVKMPKNLVTMLNKDLIHR